MCQVSFEIIFGWFWWKTQLSLVKKAKCALFIPPHFIDGPKIPPFLGLILEKLCFKIDSNFLMIYFSHTPKAKATIVADTPEMNRLAANTKIQSNVQ